mgnify:CR=1 FL=1
MSRGYSKARIDKALEDDHGRENLYEEYVPHRNQNTWLSDNPDRAFATRVLRDRDNGTFLIRPSRDGLYALSIKYVCCLSRPLLHLSAFHPT